jgi:DNA-binding NarL/FixJ family response regulator
MAKPASHSSVGCDGSIRHSAPRQTVMLTGSESPVDRNEAEMLGVISFLQKPIAEEVLAAAVQSLDLKLEKP